MHYKVEDKTVYWRSDKMEEGKWLIKETCNSEEEALELYNRLTQ